MIGAKLAIENFFQLRRKYETLCFYDLDSLGNPISGPHSQFQDSNYANAIPEM